MAQVSQAAAKAAVAIPVSARLIDAGADDFEVWVGLRSVIPQLGDQWHRVETTERDWACVEKEGFIFQGTVDEAVAWLKGVTAWLDTVRPTSPGC